MGFLGQYRVFGLRDPMGAGLLLVGGCGLSVLGENSPMSNKLTDPLDVRVNELEKRVQNLESYVAIQLISEKLKAGKSIEEVLEEFTGKKGNAKP